MNEDVREKFLKLLPKETREVVKILNNENVLAIYLVILFEGEKNFSDLKVLLDLNPNILNPALKKLVNTGLISKKSSSVSEINNKNRIIYSSTRKGRRLYNALFDVFRPPYRRVIRSNSVSSTINSTFSVSKTDTDIGSILISNSGGLSPAFSPMTTIGSHSLKIASCGES